MTWRFNPTLASTGRPWERRGSGAERRLMIWCSSATLAKSARIQFFVDKSGLPALHTSAIAAFWRGKLGPPGTWKLAMARLLHLKVECTWMSRLEQSIQDIRQWKISSG